MSALLLPLFLGVAVLTASRQAPAPALFYNQPGATDAMKEAELKRCRAITAGPMGMAEQKALAPPVDPGSFPRDAASPGPSIETCMVMRGWRVYSLSPRERDALARMPSRARARALQALTAARRPARGRLLRDGGGLLLRDPAAR